LHIAGLHVEPDDADPTAERLEDRDGRYDVVAAPTVEDALERLDERSVDCVTTRQALPDGTGLELLERLRRDRGVDLPVVLVDPDPAEQTVIDALNLGADRFLADGTDPSAGVDRLAEAIDRAVAERDRRRRDLELFRTLMDRASDSIFVVDRDSGRIEDVNATACRRLGYDREALLGTGVWEISTSFDSRAEYRRHLEEWPSDEIRNAETRHRRKDGTTVPVEIRSSLVTAGGESYQVALAREISERKEREEALRAEKERLAEFASVLSHDLRTPLEVANGRLELARADRDCEHLRTARRALDRMDEIVDDVLTLVREGRSVDVDSIEPVTLAPLARECWQTVSTEDATLVVETEATVAADDGRLRELLENLYRNAVRHGGSDVTVTVGDLPDGFYVADDGPGVPEAERSAVFEAGYSTRADGSGLGLSIVESIATAHGWSVDLVAGRSGGARFEFTGVEPAPGD